MTFLSQQPGTNSTSTAKPKALCARVLLCSLLATATALSSAAFAQDKTTYSGSLQQSEPTGRLIIKYNSAEQPWQTPRGSKRTLRSTLRSSHHLELERKLSDTRELVKAENSSGHVARLKAQADMLSSQSDIAYASVEYRRYPLLEPSDTLYQGSQGPGNQSYLYDGDYSVHAPGAWDITTGSEDSVIAIVDTGILPDHAEIANRSVNNLGYFFVLADSPDDFFSANDGDGRDADPSDPGDMCNGFSSSWHGTSVASAAAGESNNSEGLAGIDWNARLLHARALGICGGTDADIIDAVRWSAGLSVAGIPDNPTPANVVNLSLGGATECTRAWQDVIDELSALNVVFVLAAGNESQNALRSSPANCANVISVGSSTSAGSIDRSFSNHGLKVTISTGGRNLVVASNSGFDTANDDNNFYRTETGTSFSAAIVSGAISLMHSLNPDLGPAEVRAILHESATPFASDSDCDFHHCGGGVMNLARALTLLRDNNYNPDRDVAREMINSESTSIDLQREVDGTLFGFKNVRYFSIDVPQRGLLQAESSSSVDLYGYLLNSDLSVIALDDDSGDATDFRVAALVEPGTYYVAVERERHRLSDGEVQFALNTSLSDDTPDSFLFSPVTDALANAIVVSNTVTISGLQNESVLTISDGFYSLNDADLDNTPVVIRNGDTLNVATQSPGSANGSRTTIVTVGAYSTSFIVTTIDNSRVSTTDGITTDGETSASSSSGCSIISTTTTGAALLDPFFLLMLFAACGTLSYRTRRNEITT